MNPSPFPPVKLGHHLAGTKTWIGATECCALLRSFGIRAHVVDFVGSGTPGERHEQLADWVWRYFCEGAIAAGLACGCCFTTCPFRSYRYK
jgi:hypothetical protein